MVHHGRRHEGGYARIRELLERLVHIAIDRLSREDAVELLCEVVDLVSEMLLGNGVQLKLHEGLACRTNRGGVNRPRAIFTICSPLLPKQDPDGSFLPDSEGVDWAPWPTAG